MNIEKIIEKITLPIAVVIAAIILGIAFYAVQYNKQQSIERQQKREYIADRKDNCYAIEKKEREQWDNVKSHYYDEKADICIIRYTKTEKDYDISRQKCKEQDGTWRFNILKEVDSYCKITSTFTKRF